MKNFYIAVTVEENGKYYSYIVKVAPSDNLLTKLAIKGIKTANIYPTRKKAIEIVKEWRTQYRANGVYMFDEWGGVAEC
jgi:hypothetical protein